MLSAAGTYRLFVGEEGSCTLRVVDVAYFTIWMYAPLYYPTFDLQDLIHEPLNDHQVLMILVSPPSHYYFLQFLNNTWFSNDANRVYCYI